MLDFLWKHIGGRPSQKTFAKRVHGLSDDEIRLLSFQYMSARYALMQAVWEHDLDAGASEDTIEDLVDWLILAGPEALKQTLSGTPSLPERETWSELEKHSLFHVIADEVRRRFPENIYETTGYDYPYPWTTTSDFPHVDYLAPRAKKN